MRMKNQIFVLAATCAAITTYGRTASVSSAETWRAAELAFEAGADYDATGADAVTFDAVFTHESGEPITLGPGRHKKVFHPGV